jgi:uncharacterized protein
MSAALPTATAGKREIRTQKLVLTAFFGVVWAASGGLWLASARAGASSTWLFLLAGWIPTLAGLIFAWGEKGPAGLREAAARLAVYRLPWKWYALCLLAPAAVMAAGVGLHWGLTQQPPQILDPAHVVRSLDEWPLALVVIGYIFVFTALGEEIGWRGYALPRLLEMYSPGAASLILGAGWAVWHLPLFWLPGNFHQQIPIAWFVLQILASSVLYTWIYQHTRGSLLMALLFHTGANAAVGLLPVLPGDTGGSMAALWFAVLAAVAAAGAVLRFDRRMQGDPPPTSRF